MKKVKILNQKEVEAVKAGLTSTIRPPKDINNSDVFAIGNSLLK